MGDHLVFRDPGLDEAAAVTIARAVRDRVAASDDAERLRVGVAIPAVIACCGDCGAFWKAGDLPEELAASARRMRRAAEDGCPDCGRGGTVYVAQSAEAVAWWVLEGRYQPPCPDPVPVADPMDEVLPEGRLLEVKLEIRLPAAATKAQVEEWLDLELGCGGCSLDNPLSGHALEPWNRDYLITDTGLDGRRETFDHRRTEDGMSYRVRYVRTPAR